ncbi:helix-turn-helix transcriptional regulator [Streptomyces europaeiscabiei]|uniref:helix-turn-helix domain-containing protein n=1 Tax=Streptomyces europaeiscabiei TaxID=146819 RepID=UPI0029AAD75E|nr:helix-turn-helix transcriptional regulator [Streptomyces europaeiscabiei]MDX3693383.1 helix-turn-helix transcriptional regulator [Streptomyces europaeiscabiei]
MPKPKAIDPSRSTRAMYGAELRHRRERSGVSQEELGAAMFISGAYVGMLEVGTQGMQPEFAKMVDEVLDTDGSFTRNLEAGRKSPYEYHFADVVEFEGLAARSRTGRRSWSRACWRRPRTRGGWSGRTIRPNAGECEDAHRTRSEDRDVA